MVSLYWILCCLYCICSHSPAFFTKPWASKYYFLLQQVLSSAWLSKCARLALTYQELWHNESSKQLYQPRFQQLDRGSLNVLSLLYLRRLYQRRVGPCAWLDKSHSQTILNFARWFQVRGQFSNSYLFLLSTNPQSNIDFVYIVSYFAQALPSKKVYRLDHILYRVVLKFACVVRKSGWF